jgi:phage antirepressor YoqD-like protein
MTKYSDEFTLQIKSDDKTMTCREISKKYRLTKNQVNYILYKKKLTINRTPKYLDIDEQDLPRADVKPPTKQESNYIRKLWGDFSTLFRKISL